MSERLDIQRNTSLGQQTETQKKIAGGVSPGTVYYIGGPGDPRILEEGYYAIQAIEDATFEELDIAKGVLAKGSDMGPETGLQTKTLKAGHIWYVPIRSIVLAGGSVFIYKT